MYAAALFLILQAIVKDGWVARQAALKPLGCAQ